jgi:hypothetical protein
MTRGGAECRASCEATGVTRDGDREALRTALSTIDRLAVQLAEADARTDAERMRADRAEEDRRTAADRADALGEKVDQQAQVIARIEQDLRAAEFAAVQARADALQATEALRRTTEARKARGRLRRAWDGWRGR